MSKNFLFGSELLISGYVYSVSLVLLTSEGYGPYETNLYNLYSLNVTCEPALHFLILKLVAVDHI